MKHRVMFLISEPTMTHATCLVHDLLVPFVEEWRRISSIETTELEHIRYYRSLDKSGIIAHKNSIFGINANHKNKSGIIAHKNNIFSITVLLITIINIRILADDRYMGCWFKDPTDLYLPVIQWHVTVKLFATDCILECSRAGCDFLQQCQHCHIKTIECLLYHILMIFHRDRCICII